MSARRSQPTAPRPLLAVNLFDSDRIEPLTRQILLGGRVDADQAVLIQRGRSRDVALAFTCDLLTAACMVQAMRNMDVKAGRQPTRAYRLAVPPGDSGDDPPTWVAVPAEEPLILTRTNRCVLNPSVFPPPPVPTEDMEFIPSSVFGDDPDDGD